MKEMFTALPSYLRPSFQLLRKWYLFKKNLTVSTLAGSRSIPPKNTADNPILLSNHAPSPLIYYLVSESVDPPHSVGIQIRVWRISADEDEEDGIQPRDPFRPRIIIIVVMSCCCVTFIRTFAGRVRTRWCTLMGIRRPLRPPPSPALPTASHRNVT